MTWYPLFILAVGLCIVLGAIVWLRVHAFLALITAAIVVSLLAPGAWADKIVRVAEAFGGTVAGIGIIIALAAMIGKAMTESGAADRIVRMFLDLLGEKRGPSALTLSGFTLAIPVFFDTVFYLLLPLARSMYRQTGRRYVKLVLAVACSATAHALVPPTPGPLLVAAALDIDLGLMIVVGCAVALPASLVGLLFAGWVDRRMAEFQPPEVDAASLVEAERRQPNLLVSLLPIILPVALIAANTFAKALAGEEPVAAEWERVVGILGIVGNPNFALLLSAALALGTLWWYRRPGRLQMAAAIEESLATAGVIILITAAGGAFGAMLRAAEIAEAIEAVFGQSAAGGASLLVLAFLVTSLIRFAQGSTTAAMIVASAMFAAMIDRGALGFHPVYLATAIGSGGLVASWMNDSGFWIFAKMAGFSELETLRTWTPLLTLMGIVGMLVTLLMAVLLPMPLAS
jgi:gluconate:H+ symporter, GntP family